MVGQTQQAPNLWRVVEQVNLCSLTAKKPKPIISDIFLKNFNNLETSGAYLAITC